MKKKMGSSKRQAWPLIVFGVLLFLGALCFFRELERLDQALAEYPG